MGSSWDIYLGVVWVAASFWGQMPGRFNGFHSAGQASDFRFRGPRKADPNQEACLLDLRQGRWPLEPWFGAGVGGGPTVGSRVLCRASSHTQS